MKVMATAAILAMSLYKPDLGIQIEAPGNWVRAIPQGLTDEEQRAMVMPRLRWEMDELIAGEKREEPK